MTGQDKEPSWLIMCKNESYTVRLDLDRKRDGAVIKARRSKGD